MFQALIKFTAKEDGKAYFASAPVPSQEPKQTTELGTSLKSWSSISELGNEENSTVRTIERLLAPLPSPRIPIYCVGLNYHSHAKEAKLSVPRYPPLWTKPPASLADPFAPISMNEFCATSLPDYEGELVFVTSKDCKNISPSDAKDYILGYTIGNDLSCRYFQMPGNSGGQFFFAKAFDNFAPIGPRLISAEHFDQTSSKRRLRTRVNGEVVQDVEIVKDMIFSPAQILSHMSQGTTIPAGTAVMTGTAAGVGAFRSPKTFLKDGDVVEVEIDGLGILRNEIRFEQ